MLELVPPSSHAQGAHFGSPVTVFSDFHLRNAEIYTILGICYIGYFWDHLQENSVLLTEWETNSWALIALKKQNIDSSEDFVAAIVRISPVVVHHSVAAQMRNLQASITKINLSPSYAFRRRKLF